MADYQQSIDTIFDSVEREKQTYLAADPGRRPQIEIGRVFANPDHAHAEQVISKLVTNTEHELVILCGKLRTGAHSALRLEAHLARRPTARIRILIESDPSAGIHADGKIDWHLLQGSALTELLQDTRALRTNVVALDGEAQDGRIAIRVLKKRWPFHFVVADGFAYRVEEDHLQGRAYVNAKDPVTAARLVDRFNKAWTVSAPADFSILKLAA
jgi:hypothetical protein